MMTEQEVLALFEEHHAFLSGHFRLSSGLHSRRYLQCALILERPDVAERLCTELASKLKAGKVDAVVGPALGGIVISYELARQLGARSLFTERENGTMTLRRGFTIVPGEQVVIAEDVVTTGGSIIEVIKAVESYGGRVTAVAALIDRSEGVVDFGVKFAALAKVRIETYAQDQCPLCRAGEPVVKPGSKK